MLQLMQSADRILSNGFRLLSGNRFIVTAQSPVTSANPPAQEIVLVGTAS